MNIDDQIRAEVAAENAIRQILLDLEAATGKRVNAVRVDPGCCVEIFLVN